MAKRVSPPPIASSTARRKLSSPGPMRSAPRNWTTCTCARFRTLISKISLPPPQSLPPLADRPSLVLKTRPKLRDWAQVWQGEGSDLVRSKQPPGGPRLSQTLTEPGNCIAVVEKFISRRRIIWHNAAGAGAKPLGMLRPKGQNARRQRQSREAEIPGRDCDHRRTCPARGGCASGRGL